MEQEVYSRLNALEHRHWWFVARRMILTDVLSRLIRKGSKTSILEAGCGTGGNLAMLAGFGDVKAFEPEPSALTMAGQDTPAELKAGHLPDGIPFEKSSFDLIVMLDVLEHVREDTSSLKALSDHLKPGGRILITVPANPWLWSRHDEIHHHYRRYTRRDLEAAITGAGLTVVSMTNFNTFLFPLVAGLRLFREIFGLEEHGDDRMPSKRLNSFLTGIFSAERAVLRHVSFPVGVSLMAVAEKRS